MAKREKKLQYTLDFCIEIRYNDKGTCVRKSERQRSNTMIESTAKLREALEKENLTDYQFDLIEFTSEPLPRNANGKIRRI